MTRFGGFPTKTKFTPIPNVFFTRLLPEIDDPAELKVTLHIIWAIYQKRGYPRFVTYRELLGSPVLMKGLVNNGSPSQLLKHALTQAVDRGTMLQMTLERDGEVEDLYFVNTDADRRAVEKIESGEIKLGGLVAAEPAPAGAERPNIFELYEQSIGMLSPIIVEELKEAEKSYPEQWIEDAFRIAVELNKRNWRYISRILERWAVEGKDDGEHRRHSEAESDPEEYYRRYGHLLRK
jgi:DnaD/phage-associated family protein